MSWGGSTFPWISPMIIGLLATTVVSLALFVVVERSVWDPILPLGLFKNRVFTTANLAGFLLSMAFMSTVSFLPLFMQLGQGVKATTSGLATLPMMAGLMISSTVSGRLVTRTGKYKPFMLGGVLVTFLGIWLMSRMHAGTTRLDLAWRMAVLGIGLGPGQSLFGLAIQNAMPPQQLGVVTSANQFFRQIGSTMGVALFGTLLTNNLNAGLGRIMPGIDVGKLQGMGAAAGGSMSLPEPVKAIVSDAITSVFATGLFVVAAAGLVALFIPQLPMRDRAEMMAQMAKKPEDAETVIPADAHL
jgi:hypothetical protein